MIYIDLQSQNDILDMQGKRWLFWHKTFTDEEIVKAINAYQLKNPVELSLWLWGEAEYLVKAIVSKIAPVICFDLIGKVEIPENPRDRLL